MTLALDSGTSRCGVAARPLFNNVRTKIVLRRHRKWGAVLAKQLQQSMLDDALLPLLLPYTVNSIPNSNDEV